MTPAIFKRIKLPAENFAFWHMYNVLFFFGGGEIFDFGKIKN